MSVEGSQIQPNLNPWGMLQRSRARVSVEGGAVAICRIFFDQGFNGAALV